MGRESSYSCSDNYYFEFGKIVHEVSDDGEPRKVRQEPSVGYLAYLMVQCGIVPKMDPEHVPKGLHIPEEFYPEDWPATSSDPTALAVAPQLQLVGPEIQEAA